MTEINTIPTRDNAISTAFLKALLEAWRASLDDYRQRLINSEHTLQAAMYMHLRSALALQPSEQPFQVFAEAVVQFSETDQKSRSKSRAYVDLLVLHGQEVIGAIEIKYTPRSKPSQKGLLKDLDSLAKVSNRRSKADRPVLQMNRYLGPADETHVVQISPCRKLVMLMITKELLGVAKDKLTDKDFRKTVSQKPEYWQHNASPPENLALLVGLTEPNGVVRETTPLSPAFTRAGLV